MKQTKTELHTHFLGMLTAEELLRMAQEYTDYIYWPLNRAIDENSRFVKIKSIINNPAALEQLRIKHGKKVPYEELDNYYETRTSLINYLISINFLSKGKKHFNLSKIILDPNLKKNAYKYMLKTNKKNTDILSMFFISMLEYAKEEKKNDINLKIKCQEEIFSNYINKSLKELISMKVEYVEISYSYEYIISLIKIKPEIADKIKCKFLLSTGRDRSIKQMKQSAKELEKALSKEMTVGFDIMGQEVELSDKEKTYSTNNDSKSFKRKLEILIETLLKNNSNNTLRIHSGETKVSYQNTEWILDALLEIKEDYKINKGMNILPPPELRIGHGIYFEDTKNYVNKLKDLNAIIEINASSNIALSNIEHNGLLPYDYYLKNQIPVVLSTDAHGLYDTTIKKEDYIAKEISENYDVITQIDKKIAEVKRRR